MRFWDTSAVVPLLLEDAWAEIPAELARSDGALVVWWGTRVECLSALRRRERAGDVDAAGVEWASTVLEKLSDAWSEIEPASALRRQAERALAVHPLRAGDALQLAAAQVGAGMSPSGPSSCRSTVAFATRPRVRASPSSPRSSPRPEAQITA